MSSIRDIGLKQLVVGFILIFGLGMLAGKLLIPPPKTEIVEKVITKTDVKTITREVIKPDGTKVTETIVEEHTLKNEATSTKVESFKYKVTPMVAFKVNELKPVYGIMVEKYIFKNISVGVYGNTNTEVGIGVGLSF